MQRFLESNKQRLFSGYNMCSIFENHANLRCSVSKEQISEPFRVCVALQILWLHVGNAPNLLRFFAEQFMEQKESSAGS